MASAGMLQAPAVLVPFAPCSTIFTPWQHWRSASQYPAAVLHAVRPQAGGLLYFASMLREWQVLDATGAPTTNAELPPATLPHYCPPCCHVSTTHRLLGTLLIVTARCCPPMASQAHGRQAQCGKLSCSDPEVPMASWPCPGHAEIWSQSYMGCVHKWSRLHTWSVPRPAGRTSQG